MRRATNRRLRDRRWTRRTPAFGLRLLRKNGYVPERIPTCRNQSWSCPPLVAANRDYEGPGTRPSHIARFVKPSSLCCRTRAYLQVVQFKAHRSHILIEPAAQGAVTAQRPILQLGRFPRIKKKACSVKIAQWMCALHRQTTPSAFCTNEVMLFASHTALSPWFDFAHHMSFPFVSHSLTCLSHRSLLWQLFRFCGTHSILQHIRLLQRLKKNKCHHCRYLF